VVNDSDELLYANPQARLYLGLPADGREPVSGAFLELAAKQYRCEPQEAWAAWPQQPAGALQSPRYLVRPESPTARAFWLQVDVLELPGRSDAGRTVRLRDVTTQMALQRDMRGFHDMICHKLRTPLGSMIGGLGLLIEQDPGLSSAEIDQVINMAFRGAQRLHGEIEDILQYLSAPGLAWPDTGFSLSQLRPMAAQISADLGLESVAVSGQEGVGDVRVLLSRRAVELALWEILENAKKFHPEQSPTVEVFVSRSGFEEVSIQIGDDGLSLSPEQLAQMWNPYYQGEKYFTGQAPGMGLGLAMVAMLVWGVGGTCRARNREDGPGIVVELVLPLAKD
jgi:two-component system cell cycle response regulator